MRAYILSVWHKLDPYYFSCTRLKYVTEDNIFRIRLTKYKGRNITLSDGTEINKNDVLVKIHLHNVRLLMEVRDIKSELKKAKLIYRYVQNSLPGLEFYIRSHFRSYNVKGIVGITLLSKGCERLGFEIIEIINPIYKWYKTLSFLPIGILSHDRSKWNDMIAQKPNYLFMSIARLTDLYGQ